MVRTPSARRVAARVLPLLVAVGLVPAAAHAATSLTVIGTSDVSDSGLMNNVIKPGFQAAYPQYTLNYTGKASGVAISMAKAQTTPFSALIVHAASLENHFVDDGYSLEPYGRAIFWGDFVLLGPPGDPAGGMSDGTHDIVQAFEDIAAAGAAGHANFVSRGDASGTSVQEHQIWALTSGVGTCPVDTANNLGGGAAPNTNSPACPTMDPTSGSWTYPSWYQHTGLGQGPNVENANACNYPNGNCYVFTDRGTFDCLSTASCQGTNAAPSNLQILTRNNSATATGGGNLLVNSFHAYAVNPGKFSGGTAAAIDTAGAKDLLDYITSPALQSQLASYLNGSDGAPFLASSAPAVTATGAPAVATAGSPVTVTGAVRNVVPGTPPLASKPVTASQVGAGLGTGVPVGSSLTDSAGAYSVSFTPSSSGDYQVSTGQVTQIENTSLTPVFGDILQPGASAPMHIDLQSLINGFTGTPVPGGAVLSGSVLPAAGHGAASVTLLARPAGSSADFGPLGTVPLGSGDGTFAVAVPLSAGAWEVQSRFADPGVVLGATSSTATITVPAAPKSGTSAPSGPLATAVTLSSARVKSGALTLTGRLKPGAASATSKIELLGLQIANPAAKKAKKRASMTFKTLTKQTLKAGATTFTLKTRLKRKSHDVLQLEYVPGGTAPVSLSKPKTVSVT